MSARGLIGALVLLGACEHSPASAGPEPTLLRLVSICGRPTVWQIEATRGSFTVVQSWVFGVVGDSVDWGLAAGDWALFLIEVDPGTAQPLQARYDSVTVNGLTRYPLVCRQTRAARVAA